MYFYYPIAALFICLFVFFPVYLFFFARERVRARRDGRKASLAWSTLILFLVVLVCIPVLEISSNLRGPSHSPQVKADLAAIFTAQTAYQGEHGVYAQSPDIFAKLAWLPEDKSHYSYYCGDEFIACQRGCLENAPDPRGENWPYQARPMAADQAFVCVAAGNIDLDPALDVWTIDQNKNLQRVFDDNYDKMLVGPGAADYTWAERYRSYMNTKLPDGIKLASAIALLIFIPLLAGGLWMDLKRARKKK